MKDFPAAHSMDTHWFAVDEEGEIALFSTLENGAIPESTVHYGPEELLIKVLYSLAESDERLKELLPENHWDLSRMFQHLPLWDLMDHLLRSVGVWTYTCKDIGIGQIDEPYFRDCEVPEPIRLNELSKPIQHFVEDNKARLPVRFRDRGFLLPISHTKVYGWKVDPQGPLSKRQALKAEKSIADIKIEPNPDFPTPAPLDRERLYDILEDILTSPAPDWLHWQELENWTKD